MKILALLVVALMVPLAALAGQGTYGPGYYICESREGNTSYFSDIFQGPGDISAVGKAFAQMLETKYGYTGRISCPRANNEPDVLKLLQDEHKPYVTQRAEQGKKIVETGWTYNGAPSLSPPASKTPPVVSKVHAPRRPPDDDPEPAKPAAPKPAAPAAPPAPTMYAYCYAYGTPSNGGNGVKQHFYVSQIFHLAQSDRPNQAFETFLRGAHSGETISASCLSPGSLEVAQKNRQTTLTARRKDVSFDVVEVDWKR